MSGSLTRVILCTESLGPVLLTSGLSYTHAGAKTCHTQAEPPE